MPNTVFLSPQQLSQRWGGVVAIGTLANWRSKGQGPAFKKIGGRVVYPIGDVLVWEEQNMTAANDTAPELIGEAA